MSREERGRNSKLPSTGKSSDILQFPYCEINDKELYDAIKATVISCHGLVITSSELQQQKFKSYQRALRILVQRLEEHPNGLFIFAISNLARIYTTVIISNIPLDKRRELYPDLGVLMVNALTLPLSLSDISARFNCSESIYQLDSYKEFLDSKILFNNEYLVDRKDGSIRYQEIINDALMIAANDGRVLTHDPYWQEIKKFNQSGRIEYQGQIIEGKISQIWRYIDAYEGSDIVTNLWILLSKAVGSTANHQGNYIQWLESNPDTIEPAMDFGALISFMERLSEIFRVSKNSIMVNYLFPNSCEQKSELCLIVQNKREYIEQLFKEIIKINGHTPESRKETISTEFTGGLLWIMTDHLMNYNEHNPQITNILDALITLANTPELKAHLWSNLILCFYAKAGKQKVNKLNIDLVFNLIIKHDPWYLFRGQAILELLYTENILFDSKLRLFQQLVLRKAELLENIPLINDLTYGNIWPNETGSFYQRIVSDNADMQEFLRELICRKLIYDISLSNQILKPEWIERFDLLTTDFLFAESEKSLHYLQSQAKSRTAKENIKKLIFGSNSISNDALIVFTQFKETRFFQILDTGSKEILEFIPTFLPKAELANYYFKQTFLYLLGKRKFSDLAFLHELKPELFTQNFTDTESDLVIISKRLLKGFIADDFIRLKQQCGNIQGLCQLAPVSAEQETQTQVRHLRQRQIELRSCISAELREMQSELSSISEHIISIVGGQETQNKQLYNKSMRQDKLIDKQKTENAQGKLEVAEGQSQLLATTQEKARLERRLKTQFQTLTQNKKVIENHEQQIQALGNKLRIAESKLTQSFTEHESSLSENHQRLTELEAIVVNAEETHLSLQAKLSEREEDITTLREANSIIRHHYDAILTQSSELTASLKAELNAIKSSESQRCQQEALNLEQRLDEFYRQAITDNIRFSLIPEPSQESWIIASLNPKNIHALNQLCGTNAPLCLCYDAQNNAVLRIANNHSLRQYLGQRYESELKDGSKSVDAIVKRLYEDLDLISKAFDNGYAKNVREASYTTDQAYASYR